MKVRGSMGVGRHSHQTSTVAHDSDGNLRIGGLAVASAHPALVAYTLTKSFSDSDRCTELHHVQAVALLGEDESEGTIAFAMLKHCEADSGRSPQRCEVFVFAVLAFAFAANGDGSLDDAFIGLLLKRTHLFMLRDLYDIDGCDPEHIEVPEGAVFIRCEAQA